MRVLAIGIGGAGSRIVDHLYLHDHMSGVHCMKALAIDLDPNSLQQLRFLPQEARLYFPALDPHHPLDAHASIQIDEVMTHLHRVDAIQIDAVLLCTGLGGITSGAIPQIIREVRKSFVEPVFAVGTLPCRNEGKVRASKAADDIDMLLQLVDALILFDNDLWYRRAKQEFPETKGGTPQGKRILLPFLRRAERQIQPFPQNPRDLYALLNERIARYIGLMLRAGEFNEKGLEVAEVVLDAGEVLKTLTGMGIVSIGYAAERLPSQSFGLMDFFRTGRSSIENAHEKAARIVSLAKRAVYEETSISCDLTSADKALVLIAGPTHELSMRGFQTVRKWIDRSISGLEMRSGDYPVKNTRFVGIIVMLAGLRNVPRIEELRQIRDQYRREESRQEIMRVPGADAPAAILAGSPERERDAIAQPVLTGEREPRGPQIAETSAGMEHSAAAEATNGGSLDADRSAVRKGRARPEAQAEKEALALLTGLKHRDHLREVPRVSGGEAAEDTVLPPGAIPAETGGGGAGESSDKKARSRTGRKKDDTGAASLSSKSRRPGKRKDDEDFGITWIQ